MIDWTPYDAYFNQIDTRQEPLKQSDRTDIEESLSQILGFSNNNDRQTQIGKAYGFGNHTEVVIRIESEKPLSGEIGKLIGDFPGPMAIRVQRNAKGSTFFQQRARNNHPLNGEEHRHFQRTLGVISRDGRTFVIQEWVPGETIEWLRRNYLNNNPINGEMAQEILKQIVLGIIIPAWSIASQNTGVLWDIRDANFVVSGYDSPVGPLKVTFVDIDNLRHLVEESDKRDGQIRAALTRLKTRMQAILEEDQGSWESRLRPTVFKKNFKNAFEESKLEKSLSEITEGHPNGVKTAELAFLDFLRRLQQQSLLRP